MLPPFVWLSDAATWLGDSMRWLTDPLRWVVEAASVVPVVLVVIGVVLVVILAVLGAGLVVGCMLVVLVEERMAARRSALPPEPEGESEEAARRWEELRARVGRVEGSPESLLRRIALTDPAVPATAEFHASRAEVERLRSADEPGPDHEGWLLAAVGWAEESWAAAVHEAERIGLSRLAPADRATVQSLIDAMAAPCCSWHLDCPVAVRACAELAELERAGVLCLPALTWAELRSHAEPDLFVAG